MIQIGSSLERDLCEVRCVIIPLIKTCNRLVSTPNWEWMAVSSKVGWMRRFLWRIAMKIRFDSVLVSCVLHTIALLALAQAALWNFSGRTNALLAPMPASFPDDTQSRHYLGICLFAVILIGLIAAWTGYLNMRRSAWLVMFVIAWLCVFPLFVVPCVSPLLHRRLELTFSEFLYDAIDGWGLPRALLVSTLMFSAMLGGLLLPIKKFFGTHGRDEPTHRPSTRLVGFSAAGILVVLTALYAWVRIGVVYEIPTRQLSWGLEAPPPPPPQPNPSK